MPDPTTSGIASLELASPLIRSLLGAVTLLLFVTISALLILAAHEIVSGIVSRHSWRTRRTWLALQAPEDTPYNTTDPGERRGRRTRKHGT